MMMKTLKRLKCLLAGHDFFDVKYDDDAIPYITYSECRKCGTRVGEKNY